MQSLSSFRDTFGGDIVLPDDPAYDQARAVWNGMADRRPALVVRPTGVDDVVSALRFAREDDLLIAVRCGGHSIPGLSTCDDGIVIDLSRMRGAEVDPERRTALLSGGSLLADLDAAAQEHGLVCPVGVVSHTGAAGLTLGGGMGRLQRRFGLTVDNLVSVDLVTADGRLVHASEDEHPDLFWGLRGAGPNFGIATALEYGLHPLDHAITYGTIVHPLDRARDLAGLWRDLAENGPDELFLSFGVTDQEEAYLTALHSGPPERAERDLAELRAFGQPAGDSIKAMPYLETQHLNDEAQDWGHRFYMKSAFLPALTDEVVDLCVEHATRAPDGAESGFSVWAWGRRISDVPEDGTAFTGREAAAWLAAESMWDDAQLDEQCRAWGREALADLAPFASDGRYVNDVAEVGADVARTVYGDAKYDRLVALKREWDPENVFRLNQNVQP
ncbi:MAG: FAD-binding oxidoreductase [Actinobacteria bacterium]|nr:MAG: FAD-binding oxidoreductase [Actinomycetota bacterium]